MACDMCGEPIDIGTEYYHNKEYDTNYHLSCTFPVSTLDDEKQIEKRYHEE